MDRPAVTGYPPYVQLELRPCRKDTVSHIRKTSSLWLCSSISRSPNDGGGKISAGPSPIAAYTTRDTATGKHGHAGSLSLPDRGVDRGATDGTSGFRSR